ncbi:pentatricopeptide repeat-containing protein At4g13650-like [Ananas comosus]|uniref:Pentatricopeptide repeat-containing protein At4g13650-like n=1 Tax=Ananas comosus TaxID=4615 RepID=A0A6P5F798_ANACO|nr:pentatricopeptide repeat-containing protein At4g13650-like [Ananas comosus]
MEPPLRDHLSSYLKRRATTDPRAVHGLSLKLGCLVSTFLCNHLLCAYVSRSMQDARKVFDEMPQRNVVTWTLLISGYTRLGNLKNGIFLLRGMLNDGGLLPNTFTFGSMISGCARARDSRTGIQLHCHTIKFGVEYDSFVAGTLIDMYAKCGEIESSWRVFDQTSYKDVVSWTSMITCFANSEQYMFKKSALDLFKDMIRWKVWPVGMTFSSLLKIFDKPGKLGIGKQVHGWIVKLGIEVDNLLGSALISMYGKCGGVDEIIRLSTRLSRDVVSGTSLLVSFMQNGYNKEAIDVFQKMIDEKVAIDPSVITSVAVACASLGQLATGKEIHCYTVRSRFISDVSTANAIISLYGRCGDVKSADRLFQQMRDKDIISWTALLTCYGQNDCGEEALILFRRMLREGLSAPVFSVTGALRACSILTNLQMGQQIHSKAVKLGIGDNLSVENSLITMYAKCGNVDFALKVFFLMPERNIVSWNALINGFSQHGHENDALKLFVLMQEEGIKPDDYTFTGILASCSRMGLVEEGCEYFEQMSTEYELEPKMEQYACMVDLFGRAGRLNDAIEFIDAMPCEPDRLVWETLLTSCKVHGYVELGRFAAKKVLEMRPEDPSPYVSLASIHASMGMWDRKAHIRTMMRDQGIRKDTGMSWVEAQEQISEDRVDMLQVGEI